MSALLKAQDLQYHAATLGFDWPDIHQVLDKLKEEIIEFEEIYQDDEIRAKSELGDILFTCVNLARRLNASAEDIMNQANEKFARRFNGVTEKVEKKEKTWNQFTLAELEHFWDEVKMQE
jgi:nucleoside triphosphate diphosphatase